MSKADKMFKEIGYKLAVGDEPSSKQLYTKQTEFGTCEQIHFDDFNKFYYKTRQTGMNTVGVFPIKFEEHLAIHEKLKELGWVSELQE